jgi:hypothetical protein
MFLVVEKMGATAEDDELLLVFCRLVGGAVGEPPVLFAEDILQNEASKIFARSGLKSDGKPRNGFLQMKWKKKQH